MSATDSPLTLPTPEALEAVAAGARLDSQLVTAALLKAEQQTKQARQPISAEALLGTWRLRFTAPNKPAYKPGQSTQKGFYIPNLAIATIGLNCNDADQLMIQNQLQVGPIRLRFTGPAKLLPKKNLLAFDFVRLQVWVGGLNLINLPLRSKAAKAGEFATAPVAKLPFFALFAAQEGYIAARGRSGGLALWAKQP